MNFNLTRRVKVVLLFAFVVALSGAAFYGGYRYGRLQESPEKEGVEVIQNSDGSRSFYNYKYNYKITVPEGWKVPPVAGWVEYKVVELRREKGDGFFGLINIQSWTSPSVENMSSYLRSVGRTDPENIPEDPNSQFAGVPAYTYRSDARPDSTDFAVTAFKNSDIIYIIYIPWEYQDRNEYRSVLETFEFLK